MLACAHRRILLADHSKLGIISGAQYGRLEDIHLLITDTDVDSHQLSEFSATGATVEQA
jgi:DeoR family fructose operon transcriptional repressor